MKKTISLLVLTLVLFSTYYMYRISTNTNKVYSNLEPFDIDSISTLRWKLEPSPNSRNKVETDYFPTPQAKIEGNARAWKVVNHATVLMQTEDLNIITDPVISEHMQDIPLTDKVYSNLEPFDISLMSVLRWKLEPGPDSWNKVETDYFPAPQANVEGSALSWNVINHATVLIQTEGLNIITDPVFSDRVPDIPLIGIERVRKPGIRFEDLPKIDLVLISHDHYDHMDAPTIKKLYQQNHPMFVVGSGNAKILEGFGIPKGNIIERNWWESYQHNNIKIHFVPAQHHSGRGLFDRKQQLWGAFLIESNWGNIFFAGDTGYGKHFNLIKEKYGAPNLSFLPIGAYKPRWFMNKQHMNPDDAVKAHLDLRSDKSIAIHFSTFQLADNSYQDPVSDLIKAANRHDLKQPFIIPTFGKTTQQPRTATSLLNLFDQIKDKVVKKLQDSIKDFEQELNKP